MKYKNYINPYTKEDSIYSRNNMLDMSLRELMNRKDELLAQRRILGIPENKELMASENAKRFLDSWTSPPIEVSANSQILRVDDKAINNYYLNSIFRRRR